jgi:hypothetical protein
MKEFVSFDKPIGGDGLHAKGSVGVDGSDFVAKVEAKFPISNVIEPAMKVVDGFADKVEAWIPGDQKAMFAALKVEARDELVKLLAEQVAAQG